MLYALPRGDRSACLWKSCDPARRRALGVDVQVAIGTKRAGLGLTAQIAGSVALLIAFTITALGQSAWDFTKTTDPLFAGVLIHPGSLANTIDYATASATRGDIESAISAFEQLRFYNPRLGATRFQLGVLYYQLGSYAEARGYLQSALGMPDVTPELRQKIEDLLELVDKKLQPDQFSGFAQTGLRYQSNASPWRGIADRARFRRYAQQQLCCAT
jgi:tetratricopeptide (TPR) repeat protein